MNTYIETKLIEYGDPAEEILETLWIEIVENNKEGCDASLLKDDDALKDFDNLLIPIGTALTAQFVLT